MSYVNDSPNHFIALEAVSRGMKSMGMIAKVMRGDNHIGEGVNILLAARSGDCRRPQEGEKQ
jgi:hypothetical protein